jgi:hypothetical protein
MKIIIIVINFININENESDNSCNRLERSERPLDNECSSGIPKEKKTTQCNKL